MMYEFIAVERENALTIITINRPAVHNALNTAAHRELEAASNQGVRGSNPSRRTFLSKKVLRQPGPRDRKRADRTLFRVRSGLLSV
jgi:hypothetical protein